MSLSLLDHNGHRAINGSLDVTSSSKSKEMPRSVRTRATTIMVRTLQVDFLHNQPPQSHPHDRFLVHDLTALHGGAG